MPSNRMNNDSLDEDYDDNHEEDTESRMEDNSNDRIRGAGNDQAQPHQSIHDNDDPDTCRILLSTDNHLGYNERDNIRNMDSFAVFEEILYLGHKFHVDLVLLAGDVFHENHPSRHTMYITMEIIRRYCMGPNPISIQIISDTTSDQTKELFRSTIHNCANYLDPYYSIHLPIFAIHGNHDDPSRDHHHSGGGSGSGNELLAALDLLAISNLVNYFGRQEEVDNIEISPIILQKGTTKIALYGLGSLRDERLNRMWEKQKVKFLRGNEDDTLENNEDDDNDHDSGFFNIFALHQNRDLGRGAKNCVQESMIPEWMDVVVWGHEHECLIEFFESVVGTFRITQPGSSVATSLVPGEAVQKKIGILDIKGKNFRLHPVPLTQVRTFVMTELSLRDHRADLDPEDPKVDDKLTRLLEDEVQLMIMSARDRTEETLNNARAAGNDARDENSTIKYKLQRPDEILVRLRVDHVGFSTINNQRFGAKFVGQIANPSDILLFHRKKDPKLASSVKKQGIKPIAPEELERTNMEDLVKEHLIAIPDGKLRIYGEKDLSEALEEYVDKSIVGAIPDVVTDLLNKAQTTLINGRQEEEGIVKDSQIIDVLDRENTPKRSTATQESRPSSTRTTNLPSNNDSTMFDGDEDENAGDNDDVDVEELPSRKSKSSKSTAVEKSSNTRSANSMSKPFLRVASDRPKRSATKRKTTYALDDSFDEDEVISDAIIDSDDGDEIEEDVIEDDDDDDEFDSPPMTTKKGPPKRGQKGKPKVNSRATKTSARGVATQSKRKQVSKRKDFDDASDEEMGDNDSADIEEDWGSAVTRTQRSQY